MNYDPLSAPVATVLPSRILATASSADTTLPGIGKKHGGKLYIRASSCGKRSGMRGLCLWIHSISKDLYVSCITPYHCIINHVHTHKYISTYLRIWISIYIYMSVHALNIWYIYIYVCVYIYIYVYIYNYIYVYIHIIYTCSGISTKKNVYTIRVWTAEGGPLQAWCVHHIATWAVGDGSLHGLRSQLGTVP